MKRLMDKIAGYEKIILSEPNFIKSPSSYIFDMVDIEHRGEFAEYLRAIAYHNAELTVQKKNDLDVLKDRMASLEKIEYEEVREEVDIPQEETGVGQKDISNYINHLESSLFDDETKTLLASMTHDDRIRLKLYFLKKINFLKKQIRMMMLVDSTKNIGSLQDKIVQYELTIEFLLQLQNEETKDLDESCELSKIILVPDLKNRDSYVLRDIKGYLDSRKEIKIVMDKILDGYFLRTKDTKAIERYKEHKLYEYKNSNGIRVLYVVNGGYVFICSLFFKDKQRSIRINNYYEDAVNRYLGCVDYMRDNMNEADFYIEQDEYVASINEVLDLGVSYQKRVGG